MRVAVTGASGFIGRHLVALLESRGDSVLRLVRRTDGGLVMPPANLKASALVHLAFPTDPSIRREHGERTLREVSRAAADAVRAAEQLGAAQVILASSGKVYGRPESLPLLDTSPARPTTRLGELKLMTETIVAEGVGATPMGATSLRIFNVYGPGQDGSFLMPTLLAGIEAGHLVLGELDHARDWIHVEDVARAIVRVIDEPAAPGRHRVLNLASGRAESVRSLIRLLRKAGAKIPEPTVDPKRQRPDEAPEERAASEGLRGLGWSPAVTLEEGLARLL